MESNNVIELENIKKTYKTKTGVKTDALRGINLTIPQGDFVAIMGPSGSGKSTLMHIIGLLDRKFDGAYELHGKDVSKLSGDKAADIRGQEVGFVFQSFNLLPRNSVLQNVLLPTNYHSLKNADLKALEILKEVGLANVVANQSNELSGGQIQRVAIARALIMNPSILLADELTGNLDTKTAHEIMELLQEINRKGTTIILITHEDEIARYAKRIIRLRDGFVEKGN